MRLSEITVATAARATLQERLMSPVLVKREVTQLGLKLSAHTNECTLHLTYL